jgi:hypothetical protein
MDTRSDAMRLVLKRYRFGVWGDPERVRSGDRARDEDVARRLWEVSEQMTGVRYPLRDSPTL